MLSTHPNTDRVRLADNLLPTAEGGLASRPGAQQLVDGDVSGVAVWDDRLVLERHGRIAVLQGATLTDLDQAGWFLRAAPYQALIGGGATENRLYIADGLRPLWFIARRGGGYAIERVVNSVLDGAGEPYPLPLPRVIATWRNRLWIGDGGPRVQHCQNRDPAQWDPLWTLEMQGARADRVIALHPAADRLLAGLRESVWQVTGDSQYNWVWTDLDGSAGCAGPDAFFSWAATTQVATAAGIWELGAQAPWSDEVREWFEAPSETASLVADTKRRLVAVALHGRVLVGHLDTQRFGEIVAPGVVGLFLFEGRIGWYGRNGVWLLGQPDTADMLADATPAPFNSRMVSWPDTPNPRGRARLDRAFFTVRGSSRGAATYRARAWDAQGSALATASFALSDETTPLWSDGPEQATPRTVPVPAVTREAVPRLNGEHFEHDLSADCHMELVRFEPVYHYGVTT